MMEQLLSRHGSRDDRPGAGHVTLNEMTGPGMPVMTAHARYHPDLKFPVILARTNGPSKIPVRI
jgi:hypothetical protein